MVALAVIEPFPVSKAEPVTSSDSAGNCLNEVRDLAVSISFSFDVTATRFSYERRLGVIERCGRFRRFKLGHMGDSGSRGQD